MRHKPTSNSENTPVVLAIPAILGFVTLSKPRRTRVQNPQVEIRILLAEEFLTSSSEKVQTEAGDQPHRWTLDTCTWSYCKDLLQHY